MRKVILLLPPAPPPAQDREPGSTMFDIDQLDDDALLQVASFCDADALSRFPRVSSRIAAALKPRLELLC